jgi:hypothetical protein
MTDYHNFGVTLTKLQAKKIHDALNKDESVTIRISKDNLKGNINLPLTQTQINKIKKSKKGIQLKLSKSQIEHMEKTGGFLPLIPLIAGILGGVGGLTGGIASAVSAAKSNAEQKRHNEAIEQQLKSGNGVVSDFVGKVPVFGSFLQPILQKIGLGIKDINKIKKGKCICKDGLLYQPTENGLFLQHEGSGSFLRPGRE